MVAAEGRQDCPVLSPGSGHDVLDPVLVLGHLYEDVGLCAQFGTIDGIVMDRGAEIIFVSGLGERVCYGAPVFNRLGMVVGMTSGDLLDPRNAGDFGRGSGVTAVVPVEVVMSLVARR